MQPIDVFLKQCVEMQGSDLHFKADTGKAYVRVHGELVPLDVPTFTADELKAELYKILRPVQEKRFEDGLELDFAYEVAGLSRFRGNLYQQRNVVQAAFRVIPYQLSTMEDLQLPGACYDFINKPRGLVLVTGPAGSGKSTSLAAMIDKINSEQSQHIVTVEDPIEFVHEDKKSLINQRELEVDTNSFSNALKYVLRQDPDVILVGEMRDLETIHLAITAAETGHLVFATLHTVDAVQTVDRIIDVFPQHQQQQVRMQLSVNLVGVVSQTLVRRKDGRGRVAAFEVLVANGAVRNLIREAKSYQINSLIQTGARSKMQSLDQSLGNLVERGLIEMDEAKTRAKDPFEFERMMALDRAQQPAPTPGSLPTYQGHVPAAPVNHNDPLSSPAVQVGNEEQKQTAPPAAPVRGQPNRPGYKRE